jgi:two-component system cell cycle sensor histidine kinase/response regulator CckA
VEVSKIIRDLTRERRTEAALQRTEEQLQQSQKMEAIGRLAGGVAHDFNNMLSVILSYTDLATGDLPREDPMRADLKEVRDAGLRASELTKQLLAFSRQQILQPVVLDFRQAILAMRKFFERLVGEHIELAFFVSSSTGHISADPTQIEQVVMNLVVNARDAMPKGGKLTIEARDVEIEVRT